MHGTRALTSQLAALDRGEYRSALESYESSRPNDNPADTLWRAEIALYLDRLDEARGELERLAQPLDRDLANRARTIQAEIAFYDKALDEAKEIVTPVVQATWEAGDDQGHLRSTLLMARIELRRSKSAEALEKLKEPARLATMLGNDYYLGIISHCRAFALVQLGEYRQAGPVFAEALKLLGKTEGQRWEATCRSLYAGYLADMGRYDDALAECEHVEKMASELGLVVEALWARNNAARTLILLERYEEVVSQLKDTLSWERATRHLFAEVTALQLLAIAQCELGRFDEAERSANESIQLARLASSANEELCATLIAGWAAARAGRAGAVDALKRLLEQVDADGADFHKAELRIYLADALAGTQPDVAAALCAEARRYPAAEESGRFRNQLARIERSLRTGPIRIGPFGELVVDPLRGWPDFDEAVETLKRYLVFGAVESSAGNRSEAARKLNLTRSRLHDLWYQLNGLPARPPRSNADARAGRERGLRQDEIDRVDEKVESV